VTEKNVILAVDDTPESLMMLTDILTAEGYDVRPADSGELALAALAAAKPDLILLDIRMPGMDGLEVCRRLKANKESRDIPVMFISAVTEVEERVRGLKIGAVDFVSAPFRKEELLARIRSHLDLSRLRQRLEQSVAERTAQLKTANERLQVELAERIRADEALRETEARFRSVADTAPVGIWTTGPDARVTFCNRYALIFTGRTMDELTGDRWKEVVHPEDLEQRYTEALPSIEAHHAFKLEYRARRADGEYRWMLNTATPRFLANGDFAGYVGLVVDVTDMKREQEQFLAAQKLESLGVLVAGVAHNFANMLATILAEADLALSDLPPESGVRGGVERIYAKALQASGIVSSLMAYAGGSASGVVGSVNVSRVVEDTLGLFRATVSRNVELCVSLSANLPVIRAEFPQVRQVVMNLLTNAWESLPNGSGSIRVTTSCVSIGSGGPAVNSAHLAPGDYVRLEVADTGCGIEEKARIRIFDPFYTTKSLGRGLGLAAVQGIVRSLGGAVEVRSAPGQGSTFEILLPGSG
jgi:PAS domain S-box-containing protein